MSTDTIPMAIGTRVVNLQDGRAGIVTGYMGDNQRYIRYDGGSRNVCVKIEKLVVE